MSSSPTITQSEWLQALALASQSVDKVPEGWFSAAEISELWRLRKTQASIHLRKLVSSGAVEVSKFLVNTQTGRRLIPYYKLKGSNERKAMQPEKPKRVPVQRIRGKHGQDWNLPALRVRNGAPLPEGTGFPQAENAEQGSNEL